MTEINETMNKGERIDLISKLRSMIDGQPVDEQIEAEELDWRQPHSLGTDQQQKLVEIMNKACKKWSGNLETSYNMKVDIASGDIKESFAKDVTETGENENETTLFFIRFGVEDRTAAFLRMQPQTAIVWIQQLLGSEDTQSEKEPKLSDLETTFLMDIADKLMMAFNEMQNNGKFKIIEHTIANTPPEQLQPTEEVFATTLQVNLSEEEAIGTVDLVMPSVWMKMLLGKKEEKKAVTDQEEIKHIILNHLEKVHFNIQAQLTFTEFSLEEISQVQEGDVLVLDKTINEPFDMLIENIPILKCHPAKSMGHYAIVITDEQEE